VVALAEKANGIKQYWVVCGDEKQEIEHSRWRDSYIADFLKKGVKLINETLPCL
jgi:hypothetical protein